MTNSKPPKRLVVISETTEWLPQHGSTWTRTIWCDIYVRKPRGWAWQRVAIPADYPEWLLQAIAGDCQEQQPAYQLPKVVKDSWLL